VTVWLTARRNAASVLRSTFQNALTLYILAWVALTVSGDSGRAEAMFRGDTLCWAPHQTRSCFLSFGENPIVATFDRKAKG